MKKTVMVVEDAAFLRGMMKSILTRGNYEIVAEAANGVVGLTNYLIYQPEIVMLDIIMTEMDGLSTLDEILKCDPNAKVVMCSALGHIDLVLSCLSRGAIGYVLKPFNEKKLLSILDNILAERPVFNKDTIDSYLKYELVKAIIDQRLSLDQDTINKLIQACTLETPSKLNFLSE